MTSQRPGELLFSFVRHWSRRSVTGDAGAAQGRLVLVSDAVHSLCQRGRPATINALASQIGIDQSGASRLIKHATAAGYVVMTAPAADGRRREATLTAAGRAMLDQAHDWQEEVFDQLTAGWSDARRCDFLQAITDLMDRSSAIDTRPASTRGRASKAASS